MIITSSSFAAAGAVGRVFIWRGLIWALGRGLIGEGDDALGNEAIRGQATATLRNHVPELRGDFVRWVHALSMPDKDGSL